MVYVANQQLYLRGMDELESAPLAGTEGSNATIPFFSPDGQWIAFYSNRDGELQKIALTGGAAVSLCEITNPFGASWGPDDTIVFAQGLVGILRVAATGGTPEVLVPLERGNFVHGPQMLPGERNVLFTVTQGDWSDAAIVVQSLDTGERHVLVEGGTDARYLASGHLAYALAGNLLVVPFDLDRLEIVGGPVPLVGGLEHARGTGGANFDVSHDGMLVYLSGGAERSKRTLVWVDREGREEPIAAEPRAFAMARISPDGMKAALDARDAENDVWVWDFARETLTRLTFEPGGDEAPVWTPDGQSIVYTSQVEGVVLNLYRRAVDGTGVAEQLFESPNRLVPYTMTPDGTRLVFVEAGGGPSRVGLGVLTLDGTPTAEPLLRTGFIVANAHISPDGRWMAYQSNASGSVEVYVRPFPNVDSGRWQISSNGGQHPLWGPDGRELFFRPPNGDLMQVAIETDPNFRAGNPERILERGSYYVDSFRRSFDISPDGQRFLMIKEGGSSSDEDPYAGLTRIIVVQNWFQELEARVPVD